MDYVIGFDGGGTRLKTGAVTRGGRILAPGLMPTGFTMAPAKMLAAFKSEIRRISREVDT